MLSKSSVPNKYSLECYLYSTSTNTHIILYSADRIYEEDVVYLLQSSSIDDDDIQCALDISRLTNCTAVIGDTGELLAVQYQQRGGTIMSLKEIYFKPRTTTKVRRGQVAQQRVIREPLVEGGVYKMVNGTLQLVKEPPKSKQVPMQVRPGLFYRALDGRKAQVFYINKSSTEFPVVGAIETDGVWKPMVWNEVGITKRPYGAVNDLVAVWSQT